MLLQSCSTEPALCILLRCVGLLLGRRIVLQPLEVHVQFFGPLMLSVKRRTVVMVFTELMCSNSEQRHNFK